MGKLYEKVRAGNIEDREKMLAALMEDFANLKKDSCLGGQKTGDPRQSIVKEEACHSV